METLENIQQEPVMEQPKWPENPWLSIWTQPRATIRAIVEVDPERYILILAALAGFGETLGRASSKNFGDLFSPFSILMLTVIIGGLGGIISLYISGAILSWVGGVFGGEASDKDVRAAIAWSSVPLIASIFFWIPYLGLYGMEMFSSQTPTIDSQPWGLLFFGIIEIIIAIWALVVYLKCLGEVFGFSAWKALGVSILPGLALIAIFFSCSLASGSLF